MPQQIAIVEPSAVAVCIVVVFITRHGTAWQGMAGHGRAWQGMAGHGMA